MRRFLASAWFPFLAAAVLAAASVVSYVLLKPDGADIGNEQLLDIAKMAAWGIGPVAALLSLILAGILNLVRRMLKIRNVSLLHLIVVLLSVAPWLVLSWQLTDEPRYTPIARAVIDFAARELLWGSLIACAFTILLGLPLLFPAKQ